MFRKLLLSLLLLACVANAFAATTNEEEKKPDPPLLVSEVNWIFGFIPPNAWVSHHYILHNPHQDTVTITDLQPGCDCTHVPRAPIKIAPNESYLLEVLFDTRTYMGDTNRDIHLVTDYKPNPEMTLYFMSITSNIPRTVSITPNSAVFIKGLESKEFVIKNLNDKKTRFTVFLDHDSSLTVSDTSFDLKRNEEKKITVSPVWEKVPLGSNYRCLVIEYGRDEDIYRVTVPIKINNF